MTQQIINVGNTTNDGTGDTLRVGAQKINNNFTELYGTVNYLSNYTFSIPTASTSVAGLVKVDGSSITITSGTISATPYTLPTATTSVLGGVKVDGTSVTISNGVISATAPYILPTATTSVLGGVKVDGTSVTINGSGVISAVTSYSLPTATTSVLGGVKVDGTTITINGSGVISSAAAYSLPTATTSVLGGVKIDGTSVTINGSGVISAVTSYSLPTASTSVLGGVKVDGTSITINGSGVISTVVTGLSSRISQSGTTANIANNASDEIRITGFKSYMLLQIQTSAAAWVRLYTSPATRTSDSGRTQGQDPNPGSGVIAEVITTGAQTLLMSPGVLGFNSESPVSTDIPMTITNLSGGSAAITVTLTLLKLEN